MTDFIYHHKRLTLIIIIILIGGISGTFALTQDETIETEEFLTDASINTKELEEEPPKEEIKEEIEEQPKKKEITVDIKGAVKVPSVYQVEEDSRIYEIIALAGGLNENATTKNINLSKKVEDEMVIYIYTEKEYEKKITCSVTNEYIGEISKEIEEKQSIIKQENKETSNTKISLNSATIEELMTLDGIGEAKAKNIIEYREKNQGFQELEELILVPGIGENLYEKIKDYIML